MRALPVALIFVAMFYWLWRLRGRRTFALAQEPIGITFDQRQAADEHKISSSTRPILVSRDILNQLAAGAVLILAKDSRFLVVQSEFGSCRLPVPVSGVSSRF
jgi:hypothetical protein